MNPLLMPKKASATKAGFLLLLLLVPLSKFPSYLIIVLLSSFLLILSLKKDNIHFYSDNKNLLFYLAAIFFIGIISQLYNQSLIEHLKFQVRWAFFLLLFISTLYSLQAKRISIKSLSVLFLISSLIFIIDGYYQHITGYDAFLNRPYNTHAKAVTSAFEHWNTFSLVLGLTYMLIIYLLLETKQSKINKALLIGFFIINLHMLYLSTSRQMWLTLTAFSFLLIIFKVVKIKPLWLLLAFILGASIFYIGISTLDLEANQAAINYSSGRLAIWQTICNFIAQSPFIGHSLYMPIQVQISIVDEVDFAHNLVLDTLFYYGIAGLIFLLAFLYFTLKRISLNTDSKLQPYLLASFISLFFVQQQLGPSILIHKVYGPFLMVYLAIVFYLSSPAKHSRQVQYQNNRHY